MDNPFLTLPDPIHSHGKCKTKKQDQVALPRASAKPHIRMTESKPLPPNAILLMDDSDQESLHALAIESGTIVEGADDWREELWEKIGRRVTRFLDSRTLPVMQYLVRLADGLHCKEAMEQAGIKKYGEVAQASLRIPAYRQLLRQAEVEQLTALAKSKVVDALIDSAVEGDTIDKLDKEGNVVSRKHRANVKAIELALKAGDGRFREAKNPNQVSGAVTYNIGSLSINPCGSSVAQPVPVPDAKPQIIDIDEFSED